MAMVGKFEICGVKVECHDIDKSGNSKDLYDKYMKISSEQFTQNDLVYFYVEILNFFNNVQKHEKIKNYEEEYIVRNSICFYDGQPPNHSICMYGSLDSLKNLWSTACGVVKKYRNSFNDLLDLGYDSSKTM